MSELSQLERAVRFALRIKSTPVASLPATSTILLDDEAVLDAQACAAEFERLLTEATKRAERSRQNGKKGGRPKKKHPTKATLAKRKSRAKLKPQKPTE